MSTFDKIGIAVVIALVIALALGARYFCIHVYAPWMLGSSDPMAIAFMCSVSCK